MILEYRKCTEQDIKRLTQISKQTFKVSFEKDNNPEDFKVYLNSAFTQDKLLTQLRNPLSHFYFVFKQNILVGYFKLNEGGAQSDLNLEDFIELERIYLLSEYQGNGFGAQIIDYIKNFAKSRQKAMLWLGVWEKNERAIAFYQKHSFIKFGTHPYLIGNDEQTDWLMRFDLSTL